VYPEQRPLISLPVIVRPNLDDRMLLQVLRGFTLCSFDVACCQIIPGQRRAADVDGVGDELSHLAECDPALPSTSLCLLEARCRTLRKLNRPYTARVDRFKSAEIKTGGRLLALSSINLRSSSSVQGLFVLRAIESEMLMVGLGSRTAGLQEKRASA
jgi:hypothetical protein